MKVEPTTGVEPVNLFLTKEVLYLLSYVGVEKAASMIGECSSCDVGTRYAHP